MRDFSNEAVIVLRRCTTPEEVEAVLLNAYRLGLEDAIYVATSMHGAHGTVSDVYRKLRAKADEVQAERDRRMRR